VWHVSARGGETILVVEDEPVIRLLARGAEALALLAERLDGRVH
jgi:hypothetical protein